MFVCDSLITGSPFNIHVWKVPHWGTVERISEGVKGQYGDSYHVSAVEVTWDDLIKIHGKIVKFRGWGRNRGWNVSSNEGIVFFEDGSEFHLRRELIEDLLEGKRQEKGCLQRDGQYNYAEYIDVFF